jgi:hypothetical protein
MYSMLHIILVHNMYVHTVVYVLVNLVIQKHDDSFDSFDSFVPSARRAERSGVDRGGHGGERGRGGSVCVMSVISHSCIVQYVLYVYTYLVNKADSAVDTIQ